MHAPRFHLLFAHREYPLLCRRLPIWTVIELVNKIKVSRIQQSKTVDWLESALLMLLCLGDMPRHRSCHSTRHPRFILLLLVVVRLLCSRSCSSSSLSTAPLENDLSSIQYHQDRPYEQQ